MDPQERTEQIGQQIRAAREARGMTQHQLAKALEHELAKTTGRSVTVNYISGWENGRHRPSPTNLELLAKILGVPVAFFYANDH